jgi:hypothetical protein
MNAMPSTVSRICETFSVPDSAGLVSADPVRSMSVRYAALLIEYRAAASSPNPTAIIVSRAVNTSPNLFQISRRARPRTARTGRRCRVSGSRGVPSAAASTSSASAAPGGRNRGRSGLSLGDVSPQIT